MAYIDEVEEPSKDRKKINQKAYYSVLVKAAPPNINSSEPVQNLDQVRFYLILRAEQATRILRHSLNVQNCVFLSLKQAFIC